MSKTEEIKAQITTAMKARDSFRLSTLKLLSSELHNEWIAKQHELSSDEELAVLKREAKKRKDAIELYTQAGRVAKADVEKDELTIIQEFLPAEMLDEDLQKIIDEVLADPTSSATSLGARMGKVMGMVMGKTAGKADGTRVSALVREKLAQ